MSVNKEIAMETATVKVNVIESQPCTIGALCAQYFVASQHAKESEVERKEHGQALLARADAGIYEHNGERYGLTIVAAGERKGAAIEEDCASKSRLARRVAAADLVSVIVDAIVGELPTPALVNATDEHIATAAQVAAANIRELLGELLARESMPREPNSMGSPSVRVTRKG
jgi:hypothetical protein